MTEFWESKYKVCRAAFVAMGRINRQFIKEELKFLQRVQQMAFDGKKTGAADPYYKDPQFEKIRQVVLDRIKEIQS